MRLGSNKNLTYDILFCTLGSDQSVGWDHNIFMCSKNSFCLANKHALSLQVMFVYLLVSSTGGG